MRRHQLDGESAEQYIMELYKLAENCDYGGMKEELIRDRLVVGIKDSALSQKLQIDSRLTLDEAKKQIRQREAVREQQQELKGAPAKDLEAVQHSSRRFNRQRNQRQKFPFGSKGVPRKPADITRRCTRCGKDTHPRDQCPAKDAECHRCKRKGHFEAMCFAKSVAGTVETDSMDTAFLDHLTSAQQETVWLTSIQLNGKQTPFKLDTGAEVTAISTDTHQHLGKPILDPTDKTLYGPSRQPLQVVGKFKGAFSHKGRQSQQQVYVVKGLKRNLLGLPAITSLNLAKRMDTATN